MRKIKKKDADELKKVKEEKQKQKFIVEIVSEALLNTRKTYRDLGSLRVIITYNAKDMERIRLYKEEIQEQLDRVQIRIEIDKPDLQENEVRYINMHDKAII